MSQAKKNNIHYNIIDLHSVSLYRYFKYMDINDMVTAKLPNQMFKKKKNNGCVTQFV